jgi:hypothetical protein
MKPANSSVPTSILTINGGSSSIKFALYEPGEPQKRELYGKVDRIGLSGTNLTNQQRPFCWIGSKSKMLWNRSGLSVIGWSMGCNTRRPSWSPRSS